MQKARDNQGVRGPIYIGVIENHKRGVATEFKAEMLNPGTGAYFSE